MVIKFGFTLPNGINFSDTIAGKCFQKAIKENNGKYEIKDVIVNGAGVGRNRNKCVNNAKSTLAFQSLFDFDYMLFIDFDVEFFFSDVEKVLSHNKDIVSGAYHYKENKNEIHAGSWGQAPGLRGNNLSTEKKGLVKIDRCGGGFLLIKKEVFMKLPYPWFTHKMIDVEIQGQKHREETSEDFGFCLLAQENGLEVYCDTNCQLRHHNNNLSSVNQIPFHVANNALEFLKRSDLKGTEVQSWVEVHNYLSKIVKNVNG